MCYRRKYNILSQNEKHISWKNVNAFKILVTQENKTMYLKKRSRPVLQDFSSTFTVFPTESHTAQGIVGSCFFNILFGTSDLKNKSQNFDYFIINHKIVFICHQNAAFALKGINFLNQYYSLLFSKAFLLTFNDFMWKRNILKFVIF